MFCVYYLRNFIFLSVLSISFIHSQEECQRGGCYPATGDLLVGREDKITATSQCGLNGPSKYCIVSFLDQTDKCFVCDSRPEVDRYKYNKNSHLPKYMVTRQPTQRLEGWWQSENGKQQVTIQVDLEAEFVFTHLIMTFKTFRPKAMYIERSWNYGQDWSVYRYFAYDCAKSYPKIPRGPQRRIDDIICEERYSKVEPSTEGEVVMKVLDPIIQQREDPYSFKVQSLLKLTNLRVHFTELHTFGDDVLGDSPEVNRKYYYSLYEMVVRGSCSCYGHAEQCIPTPGTPANVNMVHGQCNCTHNTKGRNCEMCKDGYNDEPWRPAYKDRLNVCRKCNCHGHTDKCHFDPAVYNATGGTSGGVCDDCQHNTAGRQCEQCKPLYYRDPFKNIFDTDVCKPCDCDPSGSFGGGECETLSGGGSGGSAQDTVAGRCICKTNVEGRRCDSCKDGFWNLLESNPDGCSSCNCNQKGTVDRGQCDQQTGTCRCKRYVQGLTCSKCLEGYWSLGSTAEGCQTCSCDIGGSSNSTCDDISGMCMCKPNLMGRQCDKVRPGHFFENLDQVISEGENSIPGKVGTPFRVVKKIVGVDEGRTWTGDGFVEVKEGSVIEFTMIRVPTTGKYSIVIRYDKKTPGAWTDVRVRVSKADGSSLGGDGCDDIRTSEKYFYPILPSDQTSVTVDRDMCFQKDANYKVQIDFKTDNGWKDGLTNVDSIVLIPDINNLDIFKGREGNQRKQLWDIYNCKQFYLKPNQAENAPEVCKKLQFSISAEINNGAIPCNCDAVGTNTTGNSDIITCKDAGGQCPCKPGVVGRRCDQCAAGYFGFGNEGCKACDCDATGSNTLFCHAQTGQCSCNRRIEGRKCSLCPSNHFGFPNCRACQCSEHSSTCDAKTGECTNCKDNTAGPACNQCAEGYFGDATAGTEKDCQRCQCPGGSSGNQFSNTCNLRGSRVVCNNCSLGYTGDQCEKCEDGYFGNPLVNNGSCTKCTCNGNIDSFADGKCDPANGVCFNCTNNAAGEHCEKCKDGYFGDATNQTCRACVCNKLGTKEGSTSCDHISGQCECLENVIGLQCDQCKAGYYNLASGKGCVQCFCDKEGSLEDNCNVLDGQCGCREGYGGRTCAECEDLSWGNPKSDGCQSCGCNPIGSETLQCNRSTGLCKCKSNIIGNKCDMCAPRTSGLMPKCESCHTCNDQWEDIVNEIERKVNNLSKLGGNFTFNASEIAAYTKEITILTKKLQFIEETYNNMTLDPKQVNEIRKRLDTFRMQLMFLDSQADKYSAIVTNTTTRNKQAAAELDELEGRFKSLKKNALELRENITKIVESNIGGALNSTRDSLKRSRAAQQVVDKGEENIKESKKLRKKIRKEIVLGEPTFEEIHNENIELIANLTQRYTDLEASVKELNTILCGTNCSGCTSEDCAQCGVNDNCTGVSKLATNAKEKAAEAKEALMKKKDEAEKMLDNVKMAEAAVNASMESVNEADAKSKIAKDMANEAFKNITLLIKDISDFLNKDFKHPNLSKTLAMETLTLNISLTPEEVKELANQIRFAVNNLTGVDEILNATQTDLLTAEGLKEEALAAKRAAIAVMERTVGVVMKLNETMDLQTRTLKDINIARADINDVNAIIAQIQANADIMEIDLSTAQNQTNEIEIQNADVKDMFKKNRDNLENVEVDIVKAEELADKVEMQSEKLNKEYNSTKEKLDEKINLTENVRERVQNLSNDGVALFKTASQKLQILNDLKLKYRVNEQRALNLYDEIRKLEIKATYINERLKATSTCHASCNPLILDDFCASRYDVINNNENIDVKNLALEIDSRNQ